MPVPAVPTSEVLVQDRLGEEPASNVATPEKLRTAAIRLVYLAPDAATRPTSPASITDEGRPRSGGKI